MTSSRGCRLSDGETRAKEKRASQKKISVSSPREWHPFILRSLERVRFSNAYFTLLSLPRSLTELLVLRNSMSYHNDEKCWSYVRNLGGRMLYSVYIQRIFSFLTENGKGTSQRHIVQRCQTFWLTTRSSTLAHTREAITLKKNKKKINKTSAKRQRWVRFFGYNISRVARETTMEIALEDSARLCVWHLYYTARNISSNRRNLKKMNKKLGEWERKSGRPSLFSCRVLFPSVESYKNKLQTNINCVLATCKTIVLTSS